MDDGKNGPKTGFFPSLKDLFGGSSPRGGNRSYWWLPFAFLFLFLLAGGFYALGTMRQSAHKLVGGDSYDQFSANSAIYDGASAVPKNENFFTSEEEPLAEANPEPAGDRLQVPGENNGRRSVVSAAAAPEVMGVAGGGAEVRVGGRGLGVEPAQASMSAKLGARSSLQVPGSGQASRTSGPARAVAFQESGALAGVSGANKKLQAAGAGRGVNSGVLESLRGAFRASIYGARLASQDSAKGWIARSFDAAPEAATAIRYAEKMRTDLDVVNPDAIPQFLRDQDLSADGAKALSVSEVSKPGLAKDPSGEEKKDAKDELAAKLLPGMMNSLFKGFTPEPGLKEKEAEDGGGITSLSDPQAKQDVGVTDEFGYTTYGPSDGFQTVFDSDGRQVGCTDNTGGFSIPFGSPGCT